MFHYFFDSKIYDKDLQIDVFKAECFLLGVAMVQFSGALPPNREDIWKLLVKYGDHLERLPDDVRPEKFVYERLLRDQFNFYYNYFIDNNKLDQIHLNIEAMNDISHTNPDFGCYLKSRGHKLK